MVERALAGAAAAFGEMSTEDIRWTSRPAVVRSGGQVCVTFAAERPHYGYRACYDARGGAFVAERVSAP